MFAWITHNSATIVISIGLLAVMGLIVWRLIRNKQRGVSSCGCDCGGCSLSHDCPVGHSQSGE